MRIPYVIDNQTYQLATVLNYLLGNMGVQAVDIATAYFTVRGYQQIADNLQGVGSLHLLLGAEPTVSEEIGLRPLDTRVRGLIQRDLNREPFTEETLRVVEDLIAFLNRDDIEVRLYHGEGERRRFLHAKCYLLYGGRGGQRTLEARFNPLVGIVGSSNFTGPGLTTNQELNTVHKTLLELDEVDDEEARAEVSYQADVRSNNQISLDNRRLIKSEAGARAIMDLRGWYDRQWEHAEDFKETLIDLLWESKFGQFEYTPYEVYMKALYEYFKDDLGDTAGDDVTRTAVDLAEFQEDAVRKARQILRKYDGVMVADSVGLGKTWIGKRLLEDYAYHMRQKALVICPAGLRSMWQRELRGATIAGDVISQEELGRDEFEIRPYMDVDVILIDEAHNFRNKNANRYQQLETLISANGRRGRDGARKKIILLTATPINNTVFDLYNQINLFTGNDQSYFAAAGIADLKRYFLAARKAANDREASVEMFNLLEEVVVRRTRPFIRTAYENATIGGKAIHWPQRRLRTVEYGLERTYEGIYAAIVETIEQLNLAQYSLEDYKKNRDAIDEFELGREQALVGIFKSRFLKRLESSVNAFRISLGRALEYIKTFRQELLRGRLLKSTDFRKVIRFIEGDDDESDSVPHSRSRELASSEEATAYLDTLDTLDPHAYDLAALDEALERDIDALTDIWYRIKSITPEMDAKLLQFKELLAGELRSKKLLVFTYYRDTALYLERELASERGEAFRQSIGNPNIRVVHGGDSTDTRDRVVSAFAPLAHGREDLIGTNHIIDILISTDALSEGQNLQDAGYLLNYDLHWNPTRMVQRAGRIDRLGSQFETLWIYNMFPDEGLERMLRLIESLNNKIETINTTGFLDASILGEVVNPRNFNTLRRIRDEDNTVIQEEETLVELASSEGLMRELQQQIMSDERRQWLESLPDGIHSGLHRERARGVFFYFTAPDKSGSGRQHFWRYYDVATGHILDNRYLIADTIKCQPDTARYVPESGVDIFDIQERIIADIVQSSQEQVAVEAAPKQTDPVQQKIKVALRNIMQNPNFDRRELVELRKFVDQPIPNVHIRTLREAYSNYSTDNMAKELLTSIRSVQEKMGDTNESNHINASAIQREDLYLICFDYVWS
jgi:superfamily II DNA or RNA helicase